MREVWAAYSVRDHLSTKPFISDVMLYDRLVIPTPAAGDEDKWKDWDTARQEQLLKILGDRAMPIVWDEYLQNDWQTRWDAAKALGPQTNSAAFRMTPTVLVTKMPKHVTGVCAVAAFDSPDTLKKEMTLQERPQPLEKGGQVAPEALPANAVLAAVIGREFMVPNDPERSAHDLLRIAVDISSDGRFRRKRAAYWRWQREFLSDCTVLDAKGIEDAVEEMRDLIADERAEATKSKVKLGISFAFAVGAAGLGMFAGPLAPLGVGTAFLSIGGWAFDHFSESGAAPGPAATCISAQRAFGWKPKH